MKTISNAALIDVIAALSHDLRSTLSSASLAAGLMATHEDDEVRGFSARLNRTVQTQTALLDLVRGLVESLEDEGDMTFREFSTCLQEQGVEVHGELPERVVPNARPIAVALARLLKGGSVDVHVSDTVTLVTGEECQPPVSRSTPHVILSACGVRIETGADGNGSRFVLEA